MESDQSPLSVVNGLPGQRLEPPRRLSAPAAVVWREIVAGKPFDWFGPDTSHLLEALCVAIVSNRLVAKQLAGVKPKDLAAADGVARFDRLTKIHDRQVRVIANVATRLRLTQQSRYTPRAATTAAAKVKGARPWET